MSKRAADAPLPTPSPGKKAKFAIPDSAAAPQATDEDILRKELTILGHLRPIPSIINSLTLKERGRWRSAEETLMRLTYTDEELRREAENPPARWVQWAEESALAATNTHMKIIGLSKEEWEYGYAEFKDTEYKKRLEKRKSRLWSIRGTDLLARKKLVEQFHSLTQTYPAAFEKMRESISNEKLGLEGERVSRARRVRVLEEGKQKDMQPDEKGYYRALELDESDTHNSVEEPDKSSARSETSTASAANTHKSEQNTKRISQQCSPTPFIDELIDAAANNQGGTRAILEPEKYQNPTPTKIAEWSRLSLSLARFLVDQFSKSATLQAFFASKLYSIKMLIEYGHLDSTEHLELISKVEKMLSKSPDKPSRYLAAPKEEKTAPVICPYVDRAICTGAAANPDGPISESGLVSSINPADLKSHNGKKLVPLDEMEKLFTRHSNDKQSAWKLAKHLAVVRETARHGWASRIRLVRVTDAWLERICQDTGTWADMEEWKLQRAAEKDAVGVSEQMLTSDGDAEMADAAGEDTSTVGIESTNAIPLDSTSSPRKSQRVEKRKIDRDKELEQQKELERQERAMSRAKLISPRTKSKRKDTLIVVLRYKPRKRIASPEPISDSSKADTGPKIPEAPNTPVPLAPTTASANIPSPTPPVETASTAQTAAPPLTPKIDRLIKFAQKKLSTKALIDPKNYEKPSKQRIKETVTFSDNLARFLVKKSTSQPDALMYLVNYLIALQTLVLGGKLDAAATNKLLAIERLLATPSPPAKPVSRSSDADFPYIARCINYRIPGTSFTALNEAELLQKYNHIISDSKNITPISLSEIETAFLAEESKSPAKFNLATKLWILREATKRGIAGCKAAMEMREDWLEWLCLEHGKWRDMTRDGTLDIPAVAPTGLLTADARAEHAIANICTDQDSQSSAHTSPLVKPESRTDLETELQDSEPVREQTTTMRSSEQTRAEAGTTEDEPQAPSSSNSRPSRSLAQQPRYVASPTPPSSAELTPLPSMSPSPSLSPSPATPVRITRPRTRPARETATVDVEQLTEDTQITRVPLADPLSEFSLRPRNMGSRGGATLIRMPLEPVVHMELPLTTRRQRRNRRTVSAGVGSVPPTPITPITPATDDAEDDCMVVDKPDDDPVRAVKMEREEIDSRVETLPVPQEKPPASAPATGSVDMGMGGILLDLLEWT